MDTRAHPLRELIVKQSLSLYICSCGGAQPSLMTRDVARLLSHLFRERNANHALSSHSGYHPPIRAGGASG